MAENLPFIEQWKKMYDLHTTLARDLETYRVELGKLESLANVGEAKEIISISHHFILNGLTNSLYAQREALVRASRIEIAKTGQGPGQNE